LIRSRYRYVFGFPKGRRSACALAVLSLFFVAVCSPLRAQDTKFGLADEETEDTENLKIQSDHSSFDKNLGIARAWGKVIANLGNVVIEAEQLEFHQSSGKIYARDNVRIYKGGEVFEGEEIIYDTKTGEIITSSMKSALEPVFFTSDNITKPGADGGPIEMEDATFTTHDAAIPNFHVRVDRLKIYPDDRIVMKGAHVYAGDRKIFYFPFFVQPLDEELGYYFTPGWNSAWGAFLLNSYGFVVNDDILAKAHLDVRTDRGVGGGLEFKDRKFKSNRNIGRLNLYYTGDSNPQRRFNGLNTPGNVPSNRYRLNLQQRVYFPGSEDKSFFVDFDLNKISDEFMYEDFFPSEFRVDPRPDNVINIVKLFDQGEISLTSRLQLNNFFQTDTRTPELAIDIIRTPIGNTGFFYEGFTSYGILDEELDDASILGGMVDPGGYNRFASYHEFLFPAKVGDWLNVVPRAGVGYADYSHFDTPGIANFESTTAHAGLDLSFKLSKHSPNVVNQALGIDGVMHVVQPYLNYSFVSTDEVNGRFNPVDRFAPTTRLRPIDMPLFTSIDDIRNWQIVRAGISNRWLTKRNGSTYEWLSINNYFDTYIDDPEFNRQFSNFFTDIAWRPLPWLRASSTAQVPVFNDVMEFSEVTSNVTFMPTEKFQFSVGHYLLNDHPLFPDSDLYTFQTYTRLSDDWGFSTSHRFESDDNTLEYQQYSLHKDLASWTASIGMIMRDNRNGQNEFGVLLSLTLKAFPQVNIPVDFQPGSLGAEN